MEASSPSWALVAVQAACAAMAVALVVVLAKLRFYIVESGKVVSQRTKKSHEAERSPSTALQRRSPAIAELDRVQNQSSATIVPKIRASVEEDLPVVSISTETLDCKTAIAALRDARLRGAAGQGAALVATRCLKCAVEMCSSEEMKGSNKIAVLASSVLKHDGLHELQALLGDAVDPEVRANAEFVFSNLVTCIWG